MTDKICQSEFSLAKLEDMMREVGYRDLTDEERAFTVESCCHLEGCKICKDQQATILLEEDKRSFKDRFHLIS